MTIPYPLYPCSNPLCSCSKGLNAGMLRWSNAMKGWFCETCIWAKDHLEKIDWTLADELAYRGAGIGSCCDGGSAGCASPDCWWKRMRRREREVSE